MRIFAFALLLAVSFSISYGAETYTTSTGATFTRVNVPGKFGFGWKDSAGIVWSDYQGIATNQALTPDINEQIVNSPAAKACKKMGGSLPSKEDFERLFTNFESIYDSRYHSTDFSKQGRLDLYALFPEMEKAQDLWTSSSQRICPDYSHVFDTSDGDVENRGSRCMGFSGWRDASNKSEFRCITRL